MKLGKIKMTQNLKFIEVKNDAMNICDVIFHPYHIQYLKSFLEYYAIKCSKTQSQLTDDFNYQRFNSVQSLKEYLGFGDEMFNVDNFISKFVGFHKAKIGKTIFPSFKLSVVMKLQ